MALRNVARALIFAELAAFASSSTPCYGSECPTEGMTMLQMPKVAKAMKADGTALIHGVRVYGYHHAKVAGSHGRIALTQKDQADWNFFFTSATDNQLKTFCEQIKAKGAECVSNEQGHPDEHGLKWEVVRASEAQLNAILASRDDYDVEFNFVDHDEVVELEPEPENEADSMLQTDLTRSVPWGLDRIDQEAGTDGEYESLGQQGAGVHVYVLDTGVRTTHNDFGGRAIPSLESLGTVTPCSPTDTSCAGDHHGHGTHCAGTIGGTTYGVAKQATLHAVKVLNPSGYTSWITGAIDWVMSSGQRPAVISMSLGGPGTSQTYVQTIDDAVAEGVVVVVAAGNSNADACNFRPAHVPSAITVGSTTNSDGMSYFSNYGSCVDIFAPGSYILSAGHSSDSAPATMSGTSMACPHVAGAAAILLGDHPDMSVESITSTLTGAATHDAISSIPSNPASPNLLLRVVGETAPPTPAPAPTPRPPTPPFSWEVDSGDCVIDGACVTSPNYPSSYGNRQACEISITGSATLQVDDFQTENNYDKLTVNGQLYSGTSGPNGVDATGTIKWSADYSVVGQGWKICADGADSVPVPTPMPSSAPSSWPTSLPTTWPTSWPTSLPTTWPTSWPTSLPTTWPTVAPTSFNSPSFTVSEGACVIDGNCVTSPMFPAEYGSNELCQISASSGHLSISEFKTEEFDKLIVNGEELSGEVDSSHEFSSGGPWQITWTSDETLGKSGWKLCLEP